MIPCGGGAHRCRESTHGKGLGLLPEIIEEVAALKLLQPAPLCPVLDVLIARDLCSGISSIFARDRGGSPKRLHRPNRFRVWLRELEGGESGSSAYSLDPVTLNAGLRKPRRGFTLVAGEEKLGVGKVNFTVDRSGRMG